MAKEINIMESKAIEGLDDETLAIYYSNAKATYLRCGGHKKATRNRDRCLAFYAELVRRGISVPTDKPGQFNGPGAS